MIKIPNYCDIIAAKIIDHERILDPKYLHCQCFDPESGDYILVLLADLQTEN